MAQTRNLEKVGLQTLSGSYTHYRALAHNIWCKSVHLFKRYCVNRTSAVELQIGTRARIDNRRAVAKAKLTEMLSLLKRVFLKPERRDVRCQKCFAKEMVVLSNSHFQTCDWPLEKIKHDSCTLHTHIQQTCKKNTRNHSTRVVRFILFFIVHTDTSVPFSNM